MNNMGTGKPSDNNMRQKKAKDKKPKRTGRADLARRQQVWLQRLLYSDLWQALYSRGSDMDRISFSAKVADHNRAWGVLGFNREQCTTAQAGIIRHDKYSVRCVSGCKKVMPSIVSITGTYVTTYDYWFNSYQQESTGAGSGIIIGKDDQYLYLATNYHVVQNAKSLSVTFVDDKSAEATVKGYVENNDIAVVTVKLSDISDDTLNEIKEIQVGSSDDLTVGDPCVAIGNALGYGQSVTVGYISALNREISASDETVKVLQTDAAINPGNSGGAHLIKHAGRADRYQHSQVFRYKR